MSKEKGVYIVHVPDGKRFSHAGGISFQDGYGKMVLSDGVIVYSALSDGTSGSTMEELCIELLHEGYCDVNAKKANLEKMILNPKSLQSFTDLLKDSKLMGELWEKINTGECSKTEALETLDHVIGSVQDFYYDSDIYKFAAAVMVLAQSMKAVCREKRSAYIAFEIGTALYDCVALFQVLEELCQKHCKNQIF